MRGTDSDSKVKQAWCLAGLSLCLVGFPAAVVAAEKPPRLVLQITVDALRGDLLTRYSNTFGEGGFRYLMKKGVVYSNANYQHANTETIVGHASLATGTTPSMHGMIGNVWFDRQKNRLVYNIEDADYHLLTQGADVDAKTEIDPTQKAAKVDGRSPSSILTSTFSDELAARYGDKSKIFAVSVKDRGAVSLGGHAGKAFWFSKASGEFVTSNYYYDQYPQWVNQYNATKPALTYAGTSWQLLHPAATYFWGSADERAYETDFPGYGRTFPHPYGEAGDKYLTTRLTLGPAGDELTAGFAKALLAAEQLGKDEIPDYLAISFSSTDYVGHIFGASSLETEDNLAHLDRTLADLFAYIDKQVGLGKTLIVLSADHGQPEVPGYLNALGIPHARYFDAKLLEKSPAIAALKKQFGLSGDLIKAFFQPYLYLNRELIQKKGLNQAVVEQAVVEQLMQLDGVAMAVSSTALSRANVPETQLTRSILNNYNAKRSGDIYLVFEQDVFINDFDGLEVASVHGSPWHYDTYVPVIFAGAGLRHMTVNRDITPYDIAPTLAAYLGIKPPSAAVGKPLPEILGR